MLLHDTAVVLRRLDYSESSQILSVFSRGHGKLRVIAKGVKRSTKTRFAVGLDQLELGELVVSVKNPGQHQLAILTEWVQRQAFIGLRKRLDRLYGALYAADVVDGLTEDWDPHPDLFDSLVEVLRVLSETGDVLAPLVGFQRRLLQAAGSWPQLEECVSCGRPADREPIHFSSFEGGLVCRDCEPAHVEKRLVDAGAVEVLRGGTAERHFIGAFDVLNYHISHLMRRESPTANLLLGRKR